MKINEIEAGEKQSFRQDTSSGSNAPPEEHEIEQYKQLILANCSEAVAAMKAAKNYCFRGIKGEYPYALHGKSRIDRRPTDTSEEISNLLDTGLLKSGFTALRSNSIFCASRAITASMYGKVYMIFPFNGFKCTYNIKYDDFFTDFVSEANRDEMNNFKIDTQSSSFADDHGFSDNFTQALASGHEIMITGEYYAFYRADFIHAFSALFY
jgi:hypothetical protein